MDSLLILIWTWIGAKRRSSEFRLHRRSDEFCCFRFVCFHYIHQNPYRAALVKKMEDWKFSSFPDYARFRNDTLCRQNLAIDLIGIDFSAFYEESYCVILDDIIKKLYWIFVVGNLEQKPHPSALRCRRVWFKTWFDTPQIMFWSTTIFLGRTFVPSIAKKRWY